MENKIPLPFRPVPELSFLLIKWARTSMWCRCPSCNGRLVARKGEKYEHCFAHHDGSSDDCELAFETSVRLMLLSKLDALQIISTPAHSILFENQLKLVTLNTRR